MFAKMLADLVRGSSPRKSSGRSPSEENRSLVRQTLGSLYPKVSTAPITRTTDGLMRCRWCNVADGDGPHAKIVDKSLALCEWCFRQVLRAKGRRCVYCGEVSGRRLTDGLCMPCQGDATKTPHNLERITRHLGWVAG